MEDYVKVVDAEYTSGTTRGKDWKRLYFHGKECQYSKVLDCYVIVDKRFLSWGDLAEKNSDLAEGDKVVVEADEQEGDYHIVTALKKFEAE